MGRHLQVDRWFDRLPTGTLRAKRVSAARAAHFPQALRRVYQERGTVALVRGVMLTQGGTLAQAWAEVKRLFNEEPRA